MSLVEDLVELKALSLWQPWASLVAAGVKSIETRSWSTSYRGPLGIHAARRRPETMRLGDWWCEPTWGSEYGLLDEAGEPRRLPLGVIVATCALVDVVPIIGDGDCTWDGGTEPARCAHAAIDGQVVVHGVGNWKTTVLVEEAYGDYTPGRYAWVFADIHRLEHPIPWLGRQQLFTVTIDREAVT